LKNGEKEGCLVGGKKRVGSPKKKASWGEQAGKARRPCWVKLDGGREEKNQEVCWQELGRASFTVGKNGEVDTMRGLRGERRQKNSKKKKKES